MILIIEKATSYMLVAFSIISSVNSIGKNPTIVHKKIMALVS